MSEEQLAWADVAEPASRMFHVWLGQGEIEWVEECWRHLGEADLTGGATALEITTTYLRLITLAKIYQEFCGCAWDENPDNSLSDFAEEVEINSLALGVVAASAALPGEFDDAGEDSDLEDAALLVITNKLRGEIFACLRKAYGSEIALYSRMYRTRRIAEEADEEFEVTGSNSVALAYVTSGFDPDCA